ncbi:MAG: DUF5131 family protein [Patescibacteria group bacterium]|nr:DUF5131 family protein [Patescibacteria group bacterium]
MAEKSGIEWCDHSFNGWIGCSEVPGALGCARCYAREFMDKRMHKVKWGPHGTRIKTSAANWKKPLLWNRKAAAAGERHRVFAYPDADVFEDWQGPVMGHKGAPLVINAAGTVLHVREDLTSCYGERGVTFDDVRRELFALIDATPHLDWLLLTKRPENILRMWPITPGIPSTCIDSDGEIHWERATQLMRRPNCWLGTSIATQTDADRNIPLLLECRDLAPVLFLSCEPLIERVDLSAYLGEFNASTKHRREGLHRSVDRRVGDRSGRSDLEGGRPSMESLDREDEVDSMQATTRREAIGEISSGQGNGQLKASACARASDGLASLQQSVDSGGIDSEPQRWKHPQQSSGQFGAGDLCRADGPSDSRDRARPSKESCAISWLIVGGESGCGSRRCDLDWIRSIRDQCSRANIACFIKQVGHLVSWSGISATGQHWPPTNLASPDTDSGNGYFWRRLRDKKGGDWDEWPEDLRVRQFPKQ